MTHYHHIQSIYHNHRKNKWGDGMAINAMFLPLQQSSFQITIQYYFKFPEQSGSHRIPGKQVHRLLNPFAVWSMTISLFHPIHLLDPPADLFSLYPTTWNFILEKRKTHTARCNMELWGETATCPFHSRCVASFLGGVGSSQPELSGNPCLLMHINPIMLYFSLLITVEHIFQDRWSSNFQWCYFLSLILKL